MKSLPYKCQNCDKEFDKKFDYFEHRNIHTGETPFMCIHCKQNFSLVQQYVNHIKSQHKFVKHGNDIKWKSRDNCQLVKNQEPVYEDLDICLKSENNEDCETFNSHCQELPDRCNNTQNNSNSKLDKVQDCNCCSCKINFQNLKQLKESTKPNKWTCKNCKKCFTTKDLLIRHNCFILQSGESFQCSCLKTFTKTSAFKNHIGEKPFKCCSCSMPFNTITNLTRHIRTHTKQKPYICKDCGRGFSQSPHLRNHSSIHLGIRAMKCNECNFSCKTLNGLIKHKKKHKEGFLNQDNYIDGRKKTNTSTCPICHKKFLFKRNMAMHMKIHSNKVSLCTECGKVFDSKSKLTSHHKACHREPSICKTCGKVFASAVLLGAHEKIHVSDKLFCCSVCNKTFSVKNYLVQHMKTHSNKKQFSCSKCGKLFKVAVSLKYHSNICPSLNIPV